mgnify:CR=1 FL=1
MPVVVAPVQFICDVPALNVPLTYWKGLIVAIPVNVTVEPFKFTVPP